MTVYSPKAIEHVSPSALIKYENQPATFFLERCVTPSRPREKAGMPAHIGTLFDVLIKSEVAKRIGRESELKAKLGCPAETELPKFLRSSMADFDLLSSDDRMTCMNRAVHIYNYYKQLVLDSECTHVSSSNTRDYSWHDVEHQAQVHLLDRIPTYCKGDFSLMTTKSESPVPADWKVMGSGSSASPKPLYRYIFDADGVPKGAHKNWHVGVKMEDVDPGWATQLVFTGWQLGYGTLAAAQEFKGIIHCLVCDTNEKFGFRCRLAIYEAIISLEWQRKVLDRVIYMWNDICSGRFYEKWKDVDLTSLIAKTENWY